jgi:hypothetical protein
MKGWNRAWWIKLIERTIRNWDDLDPTSSMSSRPERSGGEGQDPVDTDMDPPPGASRRRG